MQILLFNLKRQIVVYNRSVEAGQHVVMVAMKIHQRVSVVSIISDKAIVSAQCTVQVQLLKKFRTTQNARRASRLFPPFLADFGDPQASELAHTRSEAPKLSSISANCFYGRPDRYTGGISFFLSPSSSVPQHIHAAPSALLTFHTFICAWSPVAGGPVQRLITPRNDHKT